MISGDDDRAEDPPDEGLSDGDEYTPPAEEESGDDEDAEVEVEGGRRVAGEDESVPSAKRQKRHGPNDTVPLYAPYWKVGYAETGDLREVANATLRVLLVRPPLTCSAIDRQSALPACACLCKTGGAPYLRAHAFARLAQRLTCVCMTSQDWHSALPACA
eukprot:1178491-Prorocentrum_minimum.AAC.1